LAHVGNLVLVAWGKAIEPACSRAKRTG
jgi:hypothetical protein